MPPGIHETTLDEIVSRFGSSLRRQRLLIGLRAALESLRRAGCRTAYINGSFVTDEPGPRDFDACWETIGVDPNELDLVLLDFSHRRAAQKERFGGELFPADLDADPAGTRFLDYFQRDRVTGEAKGIVAIKLGGLP